MKRRNFIFDIFSVGLISSITPRVKAKNFKINNIDLMIVSEIPKINPYYNKIIKSLVKLLKIDKNQITLKATTNEKSGLIGKSEFIACWSNLSIY